MSLTTMTSRLVLGDGDVVERLPGHAAGQRAVADDGDDVPVLAADRVGLGQPVGVGQRGRGVGVLDDVVLGLRLARVAADAALLAQLVEAGQPAGEELVDVGLVAGVEDDPVARRVEDAVQARVSSTTPRLGPRCPPVRAQVRTRKSRISAASSSSSGRSGCAGREVTRSAPGAPVHCNDRSRPADSTGRRSVRVRRREPPVEVGAEERRQDHPAPLVKARLGTSAGSTNTMRRPSWHTMSASVRSVGAAYVVIRSQVP